MYSFYLPPESGERLGLVITNLLALMVFLLMVAGVIPSTSDVVPLVSIYFYGSMFQVKYPYNKTFQITIRYDKNIAVRQFNPRLYQDLNICANSFSPKLAFHPSLVVIEYHRLLGANVRWNSDPSRGSQRLLSAYHYRNRR